MHLISYMSLSFVILNKGIRFFTTLSNWNVLNHSHITGPLNKEKHNFKNMSLYLHVLLFCFVFLWANFPNNVGIEHYLCCSTATCCIRSLTAAHEHGPWSMRRRSPLITRRLPRPPTQDQGISKFSSWPTRSLIRVPTNIIVWIQARGQSCAAPQEEEARWDALV